jgi:nitroreductase
MSLLKLSKDTLRRPYRAATGLRERMLEWLALRLGRYRWGAAIHYLLFDGSFRREMRAVLAGKAEHLRRAQSADGSIYRLRRNIHRLEKGLIMEPRRPVFAADYILPTVDTFARIKAAGGAECADDMMWARHVLHEYFSVASGDPSIEEARRRFAAIEEEASGARERIPYTSESRPECTVPYEALHALSIRRRSVRWFRAAGVARELIDKALLVARQAPSACNRQPYRFIIFDDPARSEFIGSIPGGTAGFAHNFPAVAVIVGDLSAYFSERDRHAIYTDGALAIMSFILALETLGISSCCINWPDVERSERRMDKALGLQPHERPIMLVAFGYADETRLIPYSQKAPLSSVRDYPS